MKKISYITFLMLIIAFSFSATFSQGGSNYSIFGIGDFDINSTSAYDGLAGTSIAFPLPHAVNSNNPAVLAKSERTRLHSGYRFNQQLNEDVNSNLLYQNNGKISGISTLFVIDTSLGITASFGFNPYTTVNYLIRIPVEMDFEGLKLTGTTDYQGLGGISIGYIGGTVNVLSNLSLGVMATASFGVINSTHTTLIDQENTLGAYNSTKSKFEGYGLKLGVLYEPVTNFFAGAFFETNTSFEFDKELTYSFGIHINDSILSAKNIPLFLPSSLGIGISYLTGKFRIGADYKLYNLKDMDFNKGSNTEYRNMHVVSLGVSRVGSSSVNTNYLDKVAYNFGLGYKQLYYEINGIGIDEIYGSIGMNFPLAESTMIDASFTLGQRGTTDKQMVQEIFGRLTIDISIGENWFKPFKREY